MTPVAPSGRGPALEAVFQPVQTPTTFEETVERLGTAIRLGLLPPGTRLPPERELAEELEHLALHPAAGAHDPRAERVPRLVARPHGRDVRGRRASARRETQGPPLGDEARAVLDYRVVVETGAIVLAAERAEERDLDGLERLTEDMTLTHGGSFEVYRRADVRFHIGLAEACHSPRLVVAMTEVQGQMSDLIQRVSHPDEVLSHSNAQHRRLVALLRRRDTARAVRLMREHCQGTEHILAALMPD